MALLKFATDLVEDKMSGEVQGLLSDEDLGLLDQLPGQAAAIALVQIGHDEDTQSTASLACFEHQAVQVLQDVLAVFG